MVLLSRSVREATRVLEMRVLLKVATSRVQHREDDPAFCVPLLVRRMPRSILVLTMSF